MNTVMVGFGIMYCIESVGLYLIHCAQNKMKNFIHLFFCFGKQNSKRD